MNLCQPPRANIRTPKLKAPPLSCDCHSHVLGPPSRFPYVPVRSFTPPDALPSDYLRMLTTIGMQRMIVVQASVYGDDNRCLVAALAELGIHRARGVAMVAADIAEPELAALDRAGVRAARFITTAKGGPSIAQLPEVAAKVAQFGWHVEMYVPPSALPELLPVLETLPVPVVLDHMASQMANVAFDDAILNRILRLLEHGKGWTKLTGYRPSIEGPPYKDVTRLARHLLAHAPDRCVWGTDWPHTNIEGYMPDDGDLLDQLGEWAPDPALLKKVLVDNPAVLYRF